MNPRQRQVTIVSAPGRDVSAEENGLRALGVEVQLLRPQDEAGIVAKAADAEVVLPLSQRLTAEMMAQLGRCVFVPTGAVGMDRVDVRGATECGVIVANLATLYVDEVANHTLTLLLAVARRAVQLQCSAPTHSPSPCRLATCLPSSRTSPRLR